jgi:phospholipid/cholesterol/gamma-HCH transport system substrate-binding protein
VIIKRGVKIQLVIFAIITALTMVYTAVKIIGIGQNFLGLRYTVYAKFADSGGIFGNAEVDYRGVTVGRVGKLVLTPNGVTVELDIDQGVKIPDNHIQAYVLDRSALGEQYVDLRPAGNGPSLRDGSVIAMADTHLPVSTSTLLQSVDSLVKSVDPQDLATVVDSLDQAFAGTGPAIGTLLDSNRQILNALTQSEPATQSLLNNGRTVLDTQENLGPVFQQFSHNLAQLSTTLKNNDGNVRTLLNETPSALDQANDLLNDLEPNLPTLLANGSLIGQTLTARLSGIRQLLIIYPLITAAVYTATPGDGTVHFGLELNFNSPTPCTSGYSGTKVRYPQVTSPTAINPKARCATKNADQDVRGSRNAPAPGPSPALPSGATKGAGFPPTNTSTGTDSTTATDSAEQNATTDLDGLAVTSPIGDMPSNENFTAPSQFYITGYDPKTRLFVGPDGKTYRWGMSSQLTGDDNWQTLLLTPLLG